MAARVPQKKHSRKTTEGHKCENESMLSKPANESPIKPAVEIADECSERIQNKINMQQDAEPARRSKSNMNVADDECLQMGSARRIRSIRKLEATPERRRDLESSKKLGAELSAQRQIQAPIHTKVDLQSDNASCRNDAVSQISSRSKSGLR